jgi:hypothetical protein
MDNIYKLAKIYWWLFPCSGKQPLTPNGFKDASDDWFQLKVWESNFLNCNWGVATGPSWLLVVDLDTSKDVYSKDAITALGLCDKTLSVTTPSGGRHLYYKRPAECTTTQVNSLLPAVDVRATSGYVICPPSKGYAFVDPTAPILDAPDALLKALADYKPPRPALPAGEELLLGPGDGRWEHCRRLAGMLRRFGCALPVIYACLEAFVTHQCEEDVSIGPSKLEALAAWASSLPTGNQELSVPFLDVRNTVTIKAPDGNLYVIASTDLEQALAEGGTLVE